MYTYGVFNNSGIDSATLRNEYVSSKIVNTFEISKRPESMILYEAHYGRATDKDLTETILMRHAEIWRPGAEATRSLGMR
jgi:hypothetical protein